MSIGKTVLSPAQTADFDIRSSDVSARLADVVIKLKVWPRQVAACARKSTRKFGVQAFADFLRC
jgi:hypothetical protein